MAWIPYALGAVAVAAFALGRKRTTSTVPTVVEPPQPGQRRPPAGSLPPGTPLARVAPSCGPNDPPECGNGVRTRKGPGVGNPTIGPDGAPPNDAMTGDLVGVLAMGLAEEGAPKGSKAEWWKVVTPSGGVGFSRAVDPQGRPNFVLTGQKA